ncbi:PREDICTED: uncharacterized protein LOC108564365 [Nicrophorus vespilloides]|uniref:Uncharacterized protein LOC108564365 n=1 Tax=Nicrophorus vespilloides TaxID=110193 RepID=A0ABM1MWG6_NICVS|nr:PREDICTED: uncharacterized protein LOC108564365 [Nicrophorus vespilloides]
MSTVCFLQAAATDLSMLKRIRGCLTHDGPVVCLKERALDVLNETIMSDKPMSLYGIVDVVKDPGYKASVDVEDLPRDLASRNLKLNEMIYDKVEEFFASRSLSLNLGNIIEGRGKKDKKGGMLMMGGLAMAGMMAQMFMGKIAFMAGAALLVAKLALLLSTIIGFKKLSGGSGGGGESSHVVYATSGGDSGYGHSHGGGGGGGGGGWHRSLAGDETHNDPYRAHNPTENFTF